MSDDPRAGTDRILRVRGRKRRHGITMAVTGTVNRAADLSLRGVFPQRSMAVRQP